MEKYIEEPLFYPKLNIISNMNIIGPVTNMKDSNENKFFRVAILYGSFGEKENDLKKRKKEPDK